METKRLIGFDFVRVVAIFIVIGIYHNTDYARIYDYEYIVKPLVYSSLGVFTFLSGFLLASKYSFIEKGTVMLFYKKRILRVWPLFVLSSLILLLFHFNSLVPTVKGIFGISPFWGPAPLTMWYVAMLLSLYLLTPFVAVGGAKKQCIRAALVMSVIGCIQILFGTVVPKTFNYFTVYFIGLILGRNLYGQTLLLMKNKGGLCIFAIWILSLITDILTKNVWVESISGVLGIGGMLYMSLYLSDKLAHNKKFVKVTTILSYSSFCAYLFHREVIGAMLRVYNPQEGLPMFIYILLVGVPLSFLFAFFVQKYYDTLIQALSKKH